MDAGPTLLWQLCDLWVFQWALDLYSTQNTQMQGENEFLASNPHIDELDKIEDAINTAHHPPVTWQLAGVTLQRSRVSEVRHTQETNFSISLRHIEKSREDPPCAVAIQIHSSGLINTILSREASCELWDGIGSTCLYQKSGAKGFVYSDIWHSGQIPALWTGCCGRNELRAAVDPFMNPYKSTIFQDACTDRYSGSNDDGHDKREKTRVRKIVILMMKTTKTEQHLVHSWSSFLYRIYCCHGAMIIQNAQYYEGQIDRFRSACCILPLV